MRQAHQPYPLFYIVAVMLVIAGLVLVTAAVLIHPEKHVYKGMVFLAVSLFNFGLGEIFNHPKTLTSELDSDGKTSEFVSRRRNSCGLGNILDIIGVMMFFIALSSFIYQR